MEVCSNKGTETSIMDSERSGPLGKIGSVWNPLLDGLIHELGGRNSAEGTPKPSLSSECVKMDVTEFDD